MPMIESMVEAETRTLMLFCVTTGTISLTVFAACGLDISSWTLDMMVFALRPSIGKIDEISAVTKAEVVG